MALDWGSTGGQSGFVPQFWGTNKINPLHTRPLRRNADAVDPAPRAFDAGAVCRNGDVRVGIVGSVGKAGGADGVDGRSRVKQNRGVAAGIGEIRFRWFYGIDQFQ